MRPTRRLPRVGRTLSLCVPLLALAAAACTEALPPVAVATVRLSPAADSFFVGQTSAPNPFTVTLLDQNGNTISDSRAVTYTSLHEAAFSVDARTGAITGKATGSGLLRATVGTKFAEATVKIIHPVARIQLISQNQSLAVGSTLQLQFNVLSAENATITGRQTSFSSSNVNVASVNNSGLVTAISEGTATITVTSEQKTAQLSLTVVRRSTSRINISPFLDQTLRIGGTLQMSATPLDNSGQPISGRTVNWFSSNQTIATVSAQGRVTALAAGSTTITAESDGATNSIRVTVTPVPVGTVSVNPAVDTLVQSDVRQIVPVVRDTAGRAITSFTGRSVSWQSSNVLIASVNNQGVVTGSTPGVTTLTVTIDGVESNPLTLTVAQVGSVTLAPQSPQVKLGTTLQLAVTVKDLQGNVLRMSSRSPTFSSSATNVATVSPAGVVSALNTGSATISASLNGVVGQTVVNVIP